MAALHENCSGSGSNYTVCAVVLLFMEMLPIFNQLIQGYYILLELLIHQLLHSFLWYFDDLIQGYYRLLTNLIDRLT